MSSVSSSFESLQRWRSTLIKWFNIYHLCPEKRALGGHVLGCLLFWDELCDKNKKKQTIPSMACLYTQNLTAQEINYTYQLKLGHCNLQMLYNLPPNFWPKKTLERRNCLTDWTSLRLYVSVAAWKTFASMNLFVLKSIRKLSIRRVNCKKYWMSLLFTSQYTLEKSLTSGISNLFASMRSILQLCFEIGLLVGLITRRSSAKSSGEILSSCTFWFYMNYGNQKVSLIN